MLVVTVECLFPITLLGTKFKISLLIAEDCNNLIIRIPNAKKHHSAIQKL